eukprot:Nk52_evm3s1737 gene=Nk52_evmTU3s1737
MAGKKGDKGAPKKPLSKKEKERQDAEEAERRKIEEEERLRLEAELKEREEKERREREELERLLSEEENRNKEEFSQLRRVLEKRKNDLISLYETQKADEEWKHYMSCSGLPNPFVEKEMNNYLNFWMEGKDLDVASSLSLSSDPSGGEGNPNVSSSPPTAGGGGGAVAGDAASSRTAFVNRTLAKCQQALDLSVEVKKYCAEASAMGKRQEYERHKEMLIKIYDSVQLKMEEVSSCIMQFSDLFVTTDANQNAQYETCNREFEFNMWVNLTKNPRVKLVTFASRALSSEIPKSMALSPVALRLVYINLNFIDQSDVPKYSFVDASSGGEEENATAEGGEGAGEVAGEGGEKSEGGADGENGGGVDGEAFLDANGQPMSRTNSGVGLSKSNTSSVGELKKPSSDLKKSSGNLKKSKMNLKGSKANLKKSSANLRSKANLNAAEDAEGEELGAETSLDHGDTDETGSVQSRPTTSKEVIQAIDTTKYMRSGGILMLDILDLPSATKTINGWTLRHYLPSDQLTRFQYPPADYTAEEVQPQKPTQEQSAAASNPLSGDAPPTTEAGAAPIVPAVQSLWPALKISCELEMNVPDKEVPIVGWYDTEKQLWRSEDISDVAYSKETKHITFHTLKFSPISFFLPRYTNLPIINWVVKPIGPCTCEIGMSTKSGLIVRIVVRKDGKCCLVQDERRELNAPPVLDLPKESDQHKRYHWMTSSELVSHMKSNGLNVFPADGFEKEVNSVCLKECVMESQLYREMSFCSSSFAFAHSRWNKSRGSEKIIVLSCNTIPLRSRGYRPSSEGKPKTSSSQSGESSNEAMNERLTDAEADASARPVTGSENTETVNQDASRAETAATGEGAEGASTTEAGAGEEEGQTEGAGEEANTNGENDSSSPAPPPQEGADSAPVTTGENGSSPDNANAQEGSGSKRSSAGKLEAGSSSQTGDQPAVSPTSREAQASEGDYQDGVTGEEGGDEGRSSAPTTSGASVGGSLGIVTDNLPEDHPYCGTKIFNISRSEWSTIVYDKKVSFFLKCTEKTTEEEFTEEMASDVKIHPDVFHVVTETIPDGSEVKEIMSSPPAYTDSIYQLLSSLRLCSTSM